MIVARGARCKSPGQRPRLRRPAGRRGASRGTYRSASCQKRAIISKSWQSTTTEPILIGLPFRRVAMGPARPVEDSTHGSLKLRWDSHPGRTVSWTASFGHEAALMAGPDKKAAGATHRKGVAALDRAAVVALLSMSAAGPSAAPYA